MFKPLVGIFASVCIAGSAHSNIIAEYDATPDSEGNVPFPSWTQSTTNAGAGTTATTAVNQDGVGYTQMVDTGEGSRHFTQALSEADFTDPDGWTLTGVMQVTFSSNPTYGSVLYVRDGSDVWTMNFVQNINVIGEGIWVPTESGDEQIADTDISSGFRTYQIVYDPTADNGSGAAAYYIDGQLIDTRTRSEVADSTLDRRVRFGTLNSGASSTSRYSYISFETGQNVVPEPATLGLMTLGSLMILRRRR